MGALAALVLAAMVVLPARPVRAAMCGCDKFSPGPAEALRSGGELRPVFASRGAEVVLFSDALVPGAEYLVYFTPIAQGASLGMGQYLDPVRAEAVPRTCPAADANDPVPDANPVAIEARDPDDYQPLLSLDGSGPNLAQVRQSVFPLRRQLRVTVPCGLPKLGATRIDVYDSAGTPVLVAEEDEFTTIGDPIVMMPDGLVYGDYTTGIDAAGHLYVALDLSQARDGLTLSGFAKRVPFDFNPSEVAAFDIHGMYLDTLRDIMELNAKNPANQQLFDFQIIEGTGRRSDEIAYFRHAFTDWAAEHLPPFGPEFPDKFPLDPADPYWHLSDDVLHPFGSTHTDFDHLVVAIAAHSQPKEGADGVVSLVPFPGSELTFSLRLESSPGNDVPQIHLETHPAIGAAPIDKRWHRRGAPRRHRHRHRRRLRKR